MLLTLLFWQEINFQVHQQALDALCKRYRIDNSKRTQHTALIDCDLLSKVYINLIRSKRTKTLNFQNQNNINSKLNFSSRLVNIIRKSLNQVMKKLVLHKELLKN